MFDSLARRLTLPALLVLMLALSACGTAEQGAEEQDAEEQNGQQEEPAAQETEPATGEAEETQAATEETEATQQTGGGETEAATEEAGAAQGAPVTAAGESAEVRDGVWAVGDAGEVEFSFENGALELIDARPNEGWSVEIDEQSPDEIEVDFESGNVEWEMEIEVEGNQAEIEIDQDIDPAEPGTYEVGDAGEVEFQSGAEGLVLVDARANEGWNVVVDEQDAEEIEVEFTRDNVEWDFDAELDDGELDVEIDQEITGPIPG